jgi:anti-sigma factor RsiW
MNSHGQIESDLPLFALGTLDEPSRELVEKHLAECAECRRELLQLRGGMALLGLSASGGPASPGPASDAPPRARKGLPAAIGRCARAVANYALHGGNVACRNRFGRALLPAAIVLVLLVASAGLWRRNYSLRQDLASAQAQSNQDRASLDRARQILFVLTAPDAVRVTLLAPDAPSKVAINAATTFANDAVNNGANNNAVPKSSPNAAEVTTTASPALGASPQPQGRVIYSPRTSGLVFLASNFAPLPAGKAYELWILPGNDASPLPAGRFKPDSGGTASVLMSSLSKGIVAKSFAITVESEAGSAAPTLPLILSSDALSSNGG